MAVGAAPVKKEVRVWPILQPVTAIVTLVAKSRHPHLEQSLVNGTMGIMAIGAIIEDRRMLKEKRSSPLGMAAVTVFVHTGLYEL